MLVTLLVNYLAPLLFDYLWDLAFVSIVEIRCQVPVKQIDEIKAFGKKILWNSASLSWCVFSLPIR